MDENNVLQQLINVVNNSKKLKIEYGITGQEVGTQNNIITFSSNITMEVDYYEKKASITSIRSDFSRTYTTKEKFENYKDEIIEKDSNAESEISYIVEYSKDNYENLFNPGGKLNPLKVEELIPKDSQMNNKNRQICYPSKVITDSIPGYIKSNYAIYKKDENYYDITMIMSQSDNKTDIVLVQYCNTRIYIIE